MGSFSIGGLASGLDTTSIIDQLMQVDGRPRQQLEWKSHLWSARKAAWSELGDRLRTLQSAGQALVNPATWDASAGTDAWVEATKERVRSVVAAYNSTLEFVHQKTQVEARVASPKSLQEYLQGPVARDVEFSRVAFDLRRAAMDPVASAPVEARLLAQVGITTSFQLGASAVNGTLVIDDAKLDAALRSNPQQVQDLLGAVGSTSDADPDDGVVRRISELVGSMRSGGSVDTALQGAGERIRSLQRSMEAATRRLDRRREGYERMFASLEASLGRMQSQGAWLSGQLAALTGGGG